jgi:hypothetical protein
MARAGAKAFATLRYRLAAGSSACGRVAMIRRNACTTGRSS